MQTTLIWAAAIMITGASVSESATLIGESSGNLPTLVFVDGCQCPPTVTVSYIGSAVPQCMLGTNAQPCVIADLDADDAGEEDTPGKCFVPGAPVEPPNPPNPDICPEPTGPCSFAGYHVEFTIAACADTTGSNCGPSPFTAYDQLGQKVGQPMKPGDKENVQLSIGSLECRSFNDSTIEVRSSAPTVHHQFRVRAHCGKCENDPVPYTPPGG